MNLYKSDDGETSFQLQKVDFTNANGTKSHGFVCDVRSYGFSVSLKDIWFDDSDLIDFSNKLKRLLADQDIKTVKLVAMSDFELTIENSDNLGHFTAKFILTNPVYGNSACLSTRLESQSLANFSDEIKAIAQCQ